MKLGVFTAILDHQPLETALDYICRAMASRR